MCGPFSRTTLSTWWLPKALCRLRMDRFRARAPRLRARRSRLCSARFRSRAPPQICLGQTSSNTLTGTAQAANNSTLTTTLGGTVVEVLPNGVMVIEAARQVHFSQETQTIILRGLVRPEDVSAQNQVVSTAISDMEIQVVGKGIVEDYTHRPNFFVRALESLLIF